MSTSLIRRNGVGTLDPWRFMETMERDLWNWASAPFDLRALNRQVTGAPSFNPPIDVYETPDDVLVAASLPGIDVESVNVQVIENRVTISGRQKPLLAPESAAQVTQHLAGIPRYGQFEFWFTLPAAVETEQAQAQYADGILRVRFPKPASAKPTRIPVTIAAEPQRTIEAHVETPGEPASDKPTKPGRGQ